MHIVREPLPAYCFALINSGDERRLGGGYVQLGESLQPNPNRGDFAKKMNPYIASENQPRKYLFYEAVAIDLL